jgi:hypothetical protein
MAEWQNATVCTYILSKGRRHSAMFQDTDMSTSQELIGTAGTALILTTLNQH